MIKNHNTVSNYDELINYDEEKLTKIKNATNFYLLAITLKERIRTGCNYWNVTAKRRESIAEHSFGTCMLAIHELEEIIIGDITPFDGVSEKEKIAMGRKAVANVLEGLSTKDEYIALTEEFNARKTADAKFAHLCDKLEFDI